MREYKLERGAVLEYLREEFPAASIDSCPVKDGAEYWFHISQRAGVRDLFVSVELLRASAPDTIRAKCSAWDVNGALRTARGPVTVTAFGIDPATQEGAQ